MKYLLTTVFLLFVISTAQAQYITVDGKSMFYTVEVDAQERCSEVDAMISDRKADVERANAALEAQIIVREDCELAGYLQPLYTVVNTTDTIEELNTISTDLTVE